MKLQIKKYFPYYQSMLLMAYPIVISQLGHMAVSLSNTVIAGRMGVLELASCAFASSVFVVFLIVAVGFSYSLTPLIAQDSGKGDFAVCGQWLKNSVFVNSIVGIILYLLIHFGVQYLDKLGESDQINRLAKPFLILYGYSIFPLMMFLTFKQFAEGLGFTKQAMWVSVAGNVINIVLGIVFAFGYLGFEPMGLMGLGYATLIDRTLMALVMAGYILFSDRFKPYMVYFRETKLSWFRIKRLLALGFPVAMQSVFEISAFTGAAVMIGWFGEVPLAAHQIAISMASLTYMAASGIASTASIKTANEFGRNNVAEMKNVRIAAYHLVIAFMSLMGVLLIVFKKQLATLYVSDIEVIKQASVLLVIAGVFQLLDGLQTVGLAILRGMTDVTIPTIITFAAYWVVGLPVGYVLGFKMGMGAAGIWWGLSLSLGLVAGLMYWRITHIRGVVGEHN
jgi:multidrug resistance protein, MATE family